MPIQKLDIFGWFSITIWKLNQPFDNQTNVHNLKTGLVKYSDGYFMLKMYVNVIIK